MTKVIFITTAALYWISFLLRFVLWTRPQRRLETLASGCEKAAILAFTAALVLYIERLQVVNGEVHSAFYDRPVSFLLFAWAIAAAHLATEIAYDNTLTAVFANFWAGLSLTLSSAGTTLFKSIFNNDLEWLSFHRISFLLGYAFCILAFPLVVHYLHLAFRRPNGNESENAARSRNLWRLDRMVYRMILWALPLLTAGIIAQGIVLVDLHSFVRPAQLWSQQQETLLALTAWFLCGLYLHTRLYFGWRNLRSAALYLGGLFLLVGTHLGQIYSQALR